MRKFSIHDITIFESGGPWPTKSHGELVVLASIPWHTLSGEFFRYEDEELAKLPTDIRGQRFYTVRGLPRGGMGGTEFHRVREEIIIGLEGQSLWEFEDLSGDKRGMLLTPKLGIWIRPSIMHTYWPQTDNCGHLVICNTLFDPKDPRTHDTYDLKEFRRVQVESRS